ncbi:MAG TPA: ABC transporter permease [Candidatus Deferrimicrobiaceae bacterium]|nr:ABC transporter permease [Candidatus Deferrimicrobiaceae bacterium]
MAAISRPAPEPRPAAWPKLARVVEHRALQYRRTFRASIFGSFVQPTLFLTAMGIGLGTYVDRAGGGVLGELGYLQFLAPGLLAAAVMQTGSFEAMFPILGGLQWNRTFHAMYATPIRPRDIALGNIVWIAIRLLMVGVSFGLVIVVFGAARQPLALLAAVPVAVLTGLAFAAPIAAFTATQRRPDAFASLFRFGLTPLFLFSGTFFPIASLPAVLQPIAWLSPLWHGVDLCRAIVLGTVGDAPLLAVAHVVVLGALAILGTAAAFRTVAARLERG